MGNSNSTEQEIKKPAVAKKYLAPPQEELKILEDREFLGQKVFVDK